MKQASGELNLTVVTLVAIAAILGFFMTFKSTMFGDINSSICCISSGGSFSSGSCVTKDAKEQSSYQECVASSKYQETSKTGTKTINEDFMKGSDSLTSTSVSTNTKDSKVEKSINKELSISSNADKSKEDKENDSLNKESKTLTNTITKNTSGTKTDSNKNSNNNNNNNSNSNDNNAIISSGTISGKNEQDVKKKASNGISTKGDYTKSSVTSSTSSYSEDKSTYTTTSVVKSNTSNNQVQIEYKYKKNNNGKYELSSVSWEEKKTSSEGKNGYEDNIKVNDKEVKISYSSRLKEQYNTKKLDEYMKDNAKKIYDELNGQVVFLNTYGSDNSIIENANGTIISPGVVVTTWNYIKRSMINGNKIVVVNSEEEVYELDGIISINTDLDLAFLKLKNPIGKGATLGNVYDIKVESIDFTLCTGEDNALEIKFGYLLKRGGLITSALTLERNEEGSPLYSYKQELIGINNADILKSSTSLARSTNYIKKLQEKLNKQDFNTIEYTSFKDVKEKYLNENHEVEDNTIPKKIWNKYKRIGDVENTISLNLVKSSYDDGIVSLRYVNDIEKYSDNFSLAKDFIIKLEKQGYKKKHSSTYKIIYQKGNKQVVLLSEFNYLIIIMVGGY